MREHSAATICDQLANVVDPALTSGRADLENGFYDRPSGAQVGSGPNPLLIVGIVVGIIGQAAVAPETLPLDLAA